VDRRAVLVGSLSAAVTPAAAFAKGDGKRPNILWLVSEDNNPWLGAYGDKLARTPTIDRLAAAGNLYSNAFSVAPVCAPSRFALLTGIYPESCAPALHMRARARLPQAFRTYPEVLRDVGYHCSNNAKTDYNCDVDPQRIWNAVGPDADWRSRPADAPFMAVFNYGKTHESQTFAPTRGRVAPEDVRIPGYLPDTPGMRSMAASYHNLIEQMDGEIAQRLALLEADGLTNDTIVFYYSDNGGVMPRSKRYCYDEGLRCALIVMAPPKWAHVLPRPAGSRIERPVSFIDMAPTVIALGHAQQPAHMTGRSLLAREAADSPALAFGARNRMDSNPDFVRTVTDGRWRYIRNYMPHRPWGLHSAYEWLTPGYRDWERAHLAGTLTPEQARFFGRKPFQELYDLRMDPDQLRNLADDAAHASTLDTLSKALDRHMLAINDNGFLPEGAPGEGWFESRDRAVYPLPRLMALGREAARGAEHDLPALAAALEDENPVVRYWGATGLLVQQTRAATYRTKLETLADHDPSAHVRVVAAEVLARDNAAWVPRLAALADAPTERWVRVAALTALEMLGERAQPALPAIDRAAASDDEYLVNKGRYLAAKLRGRYTPDYPVFPLEKLGPDAPRPGVSA